MIRQIAVIVPAADEQESIAPCLEAIAAAARHVLESDLGVERVKVIVVLDACVDETALIVARFTSAGRVQAIACHERRVGAARQRGAREALATSVPREQLWLANTDADSIVPADWLVRMVTAANADAHLVLGTVLPGIDLAPALRAAWAASQVLSEGHPHIHGANLGIRADVYLELGGWNSELACDEDVELARRAAEASHVRILRTAEIPVVTSARAVGRAPDGFSSYIRRLQDEGSAAVAA